MELWGAQNQAQAAQKPPGQVRGWDAYRPEEGKVPWARGHWGELPGRSKSTAGPQWFTIIAHMSQHFVGGLVLSNLHALCPFVVRTINSPFNR